MQLRLSKCECMPAALERVERPLWMHAFPTRRLYRCVACGVHIFAFKEQIDDALWEQSVSAWQEKTTELDLARLAR